MESSNCSIILQRLNAFNAAAFTDMAFRAHQHVLYKLHAEGPWIAQGALVDGLPAGLVLGEAQGSKAAILSICVKARVSQPWFGDTPSKCNGDGAACKGSAGSVVHLRDGQAGYTGRRATAGKMRLARATAEALGLLVRQTDVYGSLDVRI